MKPFVRFETVRALRRRAHLRILFASDLHLGLPWTRNVTRDLIEVAAAQSPDLIVLGGDLVDNARGLDSLRTCLRRMARRWVVAAIPGNHDVAVGEKRVRRFVLDAGSAWLGDQPLTISAPGGEFVRFTCGSRCGPLGDAVNVACLHDPSDVEEAVTAGFDLAFAGHLHGGQCVFFEFRGRLYPWAWFNRWTGLRFQIGNLRLFISRGLGDTLPLRWNCPHEVIVCDLTGDERE